MIAEKMKNMVANSSAIRAMFEILIYAHFVRSIIVR